MDQSPKKNKDISYCLPKSLPFYLGTTLQESGQKEIKNFEFNFQEYSSISITCEPNDQNSSFKYYLILASKEMTPDLLLAEIGNIIAADLIHYFKENTKNKIWYVSAPTEYSQDSSRKSLSKIMNHAKILDHKTYLSPDQSQKPFDVFLIEEPSSIQKIGNA